MNIIIQKAKSSDFLQLASLDRASWKANPHSDFIPDGEHAWRLWCEYSQVFSCIKEGKIIGAAVAFRIDDAPSYAIHKIFVAPEYRGLGIAKKLMNSLVRSLEDKKMSSFLTVDPNNKAAISLYRSFGFVSEKLVRGYYRPEEDRLIMTRSTSTF